MESILNLDQHLFLWLNSLGTDFWDPFWLLVTNKWTFVPLYVLLLIYIFKQYRWKKRLIFIGFVSILITLSDQTSNLFKRSFKRLRPCHELTIKQQVRLVKKGCGGRYGFFSGHASNNFALATFLIITLPFTWRYYLLILAGLISYSRIYVGVHYPLDLVVGAFFGALYGLGLGFLCARLSSKTNL